MTALAALKADIDAWNKSQLTDIPEKREDEPRLKVVGQIEKFGIKEGKTGNKPWTLCIITIAGVDYTTFDKKLGVLAESSQSLKETVTMYYKQGAKGNEALEIVTPTDVPH